MLDEVMKYRGEVGESRGEKNCYIEVYSNGDPRFIRITSGQKEKLAEVLLKTDAKFVKIGEKLINVSAIKEIDFNSNFSQGTI